MNDKNLTQLWSRLTKIAVFMLLALNAQAEEPTVGATVSDLAIFGKNTSTLIQEMSFSPELLKVNESVVFFQSGVRVSEANLEQGYSYCTLTLNRDKEARRSQLRLEQGRLKIALSEEGIEQNMEFSSLENSNSVIAVLACNYYEMEAMTLGVVKDAFGVYLERVQWILR